MHYNVNAPVSLDGGSGFDKVVVLGTEFADDIVITSKGVLGAGLNVRYANVEVVEVDGLEGDDEFFVQSTAFGVAYRVIGGLGSDTINVTGDVTEDIVVRELEGVSGAVNHLVFSGDPLYDGVVVDGIDVNVATPTSGNVIITETGGFTAVREGGPVAFDKYFVRLAAEPGANIVYVTVSAARSPQEEADGLGPSTHKGDTIWVCTGADAACDDAFAEFQRHIFVNSDTVSRVPQRAVVLKFTGGAGGNWDIDQVVHVYAVDDLRPEGDARRRRQPQRHLRPTRATTATLVRNVEVHGARQRHAGRARARGAAGDVDRGQPHGRDRGRRTTTGLADELLVQLAAKPVSGTVVVHLKLDEDSEEWISIARGDALDTRFDAATRTITFTSADGDWDDPVRLRVSSRDNDRRQDPRTAVIEFEKDASSTAPNYDFPSLYAPPVRVAVEVLDDETAGAVVLESAGGTLVVVRRRHRRLLHPPPAPADGAGAGRDPHGRPDRREDDQRPAVRLPGDRRLPRHAALHRRRRARQRRLGPDHAHAGRRRQLPRRGLRARHVHPDRGRGRGERRPLRLRGERVDDHAHRRPASRAAASPARSSASSSARGCGRARSRPRQPRPPPTARRPPRAASSSAPTARAGSRTASSRASACASATRGPPRAPTSRSR